MTGEVHQEQLFCNHLLTVDGTMASEQTIWTAIDNHPQWVFDFRLAPRFDYGGLSRQVVLALFRDREIRYRDVWRMLDVRSHRVAAEQFGVAARCAADVLLTEHAGFPLSMVVLADNRKDMDRARFAMLECLRPLSPHNWRLTQLPEIHEQQQGLPRSSD